MSERSVTALLWAMVIAGVCIVGLALAAAAAGLAGGDATEV